MIEVITQPSHLAGAKVEVARATEGGPVILILDRTQAKRGPPLPPHLVGMGIVVEFEPVEVNEADVTTRHMLPATLDTFRALLGPCPEPMDVELALALIDAAIPSDVKAETISYDAYEPPSSLGWTPTTRVVGKARTAVPCPEAGGGAPSDAHREVARLRAEVERRVVLREEDERDLLRRTGLQALLNDGAGHG